MKEIYSNQKYLRVFHDETTNYLLLRWQSFAISLRQIKFMHRSILDYAVAHGCRHYVADTSETKGMLTPEILGWWRSDWIPEMRAEGIEMIVTIVANDIFSHMSNDDWQTGNYGGIELRNVLTLTDAERLILYSRGLETLASAHLTD